MNSPNANETLWAVLKGSFASDPWWRLLGVDADQVSRGSARFRLHLSDAVRRQASGSVREGVLAALKQLQHVAQLPVQQQPGCPSIGSEAASIFGDVDCDDDVDSVDARRVLRHVAELPNNLPQGCREIGR